MDGHRPASGAIVWKWRDESGWKDYPRDISATIETAYSAGQNRIQLNQGWFAGKGYYVHTSKMVQYNKITDGFRHIQRVDPSRPITWHWNNGEEWIAYDAETTLQVETAFQNNDRVVKLTQGFFQGKKFVIQMKNSLIVQVNAENGVAREVRRNHSHWVKKVRPHGPFSMPSPKLVQGQGQAHIFGVHLNSGGAAPTFGAHTQLYQGWVWQKDNDWKQYDPEVSKYIDHAYQTKEEYVRLNIGIFEHDPNTYIIDFTRVVQVNLESGMIRPVRRIGGKINVPTTKDVYQLPAGVKWKTPQHVTPVLATRPIRSVSKKLEAHPFLQPQQAAAPTPTVAVVPDASAAAPPPSIAVVNPPNQGTGLSASMQRNQRKIFSAPVSPATSPPVSPRQSQKRPEPKNQKESTSLPSSPNASPPHSPRRRERTPFMGRNSEIIRTPPVLDSTLAAAKLRILEAGEQFKRDFEEDEPEVDDD